MTVSEVVGIHDKPIRGVIDELYELIGLAAEGKIIGIGYAVITDRQHVQGGLAGTLVKNKHKAASAMRVIADAVNAHDERVGIY